MSVFGPAFPPHGGVVLPAQWATHGGLLPVHGGIDPTVGPLPIPIGFELIPDPTIAVSGNWVFSRSTFLNPGAQFNTTTVANLWLAVPNTKNQVLTPGTYRVALTVANWISQTTFISVGVGSDTGGSSLTNGSIPANTITGNGVWTIDIVVAANTLGQGVKLRESSGSGIQMDFTNISLKRIS